MRPAFILNDDVVFSSLGHFASFGCLLVRFLFVVFCWFCFVFGCYCFVFAGSFVGSFVGFVDSRCCFFVSLSGFICWFLLILVLGSFCSFCCFSLLVLFGFVVLVLFRWSLLCVVSYDLF